MKAFLNTMSSFRFKLALSFLVVLIASLLTVYVVTERLVRQDFRLYLVHGNSRRAQQLESELLQFYRQRGSWEGVEELLEDRPGPGGGYGPGSGGNRGSVLVDERGQVIFSTADDLKAKTLPDTVLQQGITLELGGRKIGTYLAGPVASSQFGQAEKRFLGSLRRSMFIGGLLGLIPVLLLGGFLFFELMKPLRKLVRATGKLASGDLDSNVSIQASTEFERLGTAFNSMTESLAESRRIRSRMIADIAHELRTPLTIIQGSIEALKEGIYEPTPERLAEIEDDTKALHRLVDDLHDLSMAESGELPIEKQPTDLNDLIEGLLSGYQKELEEQGISLSTDLADNLPTIELDPYRVEQVISNLLNNSVRYTSGGDKIKVSTLFRENKAYVEVYDTGEGIPAQSLSNIFERLYRVDESRTEGGTGLGLSIAQALVKAHGGDIWAESEYGEWTRITFTLPFSS